MTISRATLHNEEDINRKKIREGDDVIVQRAGDVIPQIVGPAGPHRRGTKPFRMPERCPLCDTPIVKPEGEAMHRCPNRACPSRGLESLINWVQAAADIDGVGEQLVRRLWQRARALPARALPADEGAAPRARRVRGDLRDERSRGDRGSKRDPVPRVLFGLNIAGVGWVPAQNLARHFGSVEPLLTATRRRHGVQGIGPERAEAVAEWFADKENRALVAELRPRAALRAGADDRPVEGP